MDLGPLPDQLQPVVAFHGHLCPGLLIGYRAVQAASQALDLGRSEDEELVTVAENNSCSVDAFQQMLSTTFGKGNLVWQDNGKQAFTVMDRRKNRAVRVSFIGDRLKHQRPGGGTDREAFARELLNAPLDSLFKVEEVAVEPPPRAVIETSIICGRCGEPTQASRAVTVDGKTLCRPCAAEVNA
ncbi:MAG: TraR/DksA C4-type zinc finger protein [Proteobacteria bacterium]|nr:TraR/DksA C4-type zinc finger protein [Pseudomonadota bacterium]MBU1450590.1 TraR/DksA C4-type zinc finger protein [Pseudomonadota bacterium]MBU2469169.1 TraR/DksA C4-type zinc finger protein [Pseudomonadota bacterium]MBU2516899.1 TraR/DksA C4-type zinc finger protein [Pseudomonadota bacterium]